MAKKIIAKSVVKRKEGMLYYVDKKGNVVETKMSWNKNKKSKK